MRKKEVENRIMEVEKYFDVRIDCLHQRMDAINNEFDKFYRKTEELIDKLTTKVDEQEEFLQKIVCPFIADKLANDLGDHLKGLGDVLADLLAENPKKTVKNVGKTTSRDEKSVGKKTNKVKKENK